MDRIFGNASISNTTSWQPEPLTRGTYSILSSCLITLGLCIWTAVHLNIPAQGEPMRQIGRKAGWMVLGFLAPELVAFTAFQQYREAASLTRTMNKSPTVEYPEREPGPNSQTLSPLRRLRRTMRMPGLRKRETRAKTEADVEAPEPEVPRQPKRDEEPVRKHPWTIVHSYFARMGGFAIQIDDSIGNFLPLKSLEGVERHSRLTLTPEGLLFLEGLSPGLIPDLPRTGIEDKSKGSMFAKSIVCFQAAWFCIQCLTRFSQQLAISLLELNTFGHALCTLFIYFMWWNKPLDIQEPEQIVIKTLELSEYVAKMCRESNFEYISQRYGFGSRSEWTELNLPVGHRMGSSQGHIRPSRGIRAVLSTARWLFTDLIIDIDPDFISRTSEGPSDVANTTPTPTVQGEMERFFLDRPLNGITIKDPDKAVSQLPESFSVDISRGDIQRWKLAARAPLGIDVPQQSLATRIRNFPSFEFASGQWPLYVGLGLTGFIYGGLHCLAWNAPFPSAAEGLLWRLSSVSITSTGVLVTLVISWNAFPPFWSYEFDWKRPSWDIGVKAPTLLLMRFLDKVYDVFPFNLRIVQRLHDKLKVPRFLDIALLTVHSAIYCILYIFFALTSTLLKPFFDIAVILLIILYAVARVYLVVECFINLGHLPPSAYQLPQWSRYVPHIA